MTRKAIFTLGAALCAAAAIFFLVYFHKFDLVGALVLLTFFAYFISWKKRFGSNKSFDLFAQMGQGASSPMRELAKAIACLVGGGAIAAVASFAVSHIQLAVTVGLTATVAGVVGFVLFLMRAISAQVSSRNRR